MIYNLLLKLLLKLGEVTVFSAVCQINSKRGVFKFAMNINLQRVQRLAILS